MKKAPFYIYTARNIYANYKRKKIPLYIDCDGVILDTIAAAKRIARRLGYDPDDFKSLHEFFIHDANWEEIIEEAGIIDNAVETITALYNSGKYDITILTKLSREKLAYYEWRYDKDVPTYTSEIGDGTTPLDADKCDELFKLHVLKMLLLGIPIIAIDINHSKELVVNPKGAIIIEDAIRNCRYWAKQGGIAVLFSPESREDYVYDYREDALNNRITDEEAECMISSIDELENLPAVQALLRKHFFLPNTRIHHLQKKK